MDYSHKAILEFILLTYTGRAVLYLLAFGKHHNNNIRLFSCNLRTGTDGILYYNKIHPETIALFYVYFLSFALDCFLVLKVIIGGPLVLIYNSCTF